MKILTVSLLAILLCALFAGGCARTPPTLPEKVASMAAEHPHPSFSQRLEATLRALEEEQGCRVGVSVRAKDADVAFSYRGGELFHPASTMKVPVMMEVFRQIDAGNFRLQDTIAVTQTFRSMIDGSEFEAAPRAVLKEYLGKRATVLLLVEQMIVTSDNAATNLLIELCRSQRITASMRAIGVKDGYVIRGLMDDQAYRAGISNFMTPDGLTRVVEAIDNDEAASPESCEEMRRILLAQEYNSMIPAQLPEGVRVGHKTGGIAGVKTDTGIVYAPFGTYYVTIMTNDLSDDDAAVLSIAAFSRQVYDEMEMMMAAKP